jgi:ABC-type transporter Mla maintaining outer membrane lipid asymmetry ATPase subunit MlaF
VLASSMEQLIRHLVRREGVSALIITAEVQTLGERFDHAAILDQGRIVWQGPATEALPTRHPLLAAA